MSGENLKYPVGIQDFAKIREDKFIYVDKTDLVYELVNRINYVFLSRPRRFGKSLLLSTIRYYFEGRKDLFEGLKIMDLEKEWEKYPVIHLQLSSFQKDKKDSLFEVLDQQLRFWEDSYGLKKQSSDFSARFRDLIINVKKLTDERVVILIDEYDSPLINTIDQPEIHSSNRGILKSIYTNLKDLDEYIRFAMLTGITRFGKMSVFSSLNNLYDITLDNNFAAICGITHEEVTEYFPQGLHELSLRNDWSKEEGINELKRHYDGYHFAAYSPDIYNPFSILNAFSKKEIENYWFSTGTPSFLVERLKKEDTDLSEFLNQKVQISTITASDSTYNSIVALLFQTGYLTIKGYDSSRKRFTLGIPNEEVKEGLNRLFLKDFLYPHNETGDAWINRLTDCIETGKPDDFLENLRSFFSGVPFDLSKGNKEVYFHNAFYILCNLIGLYVKAEYHTSFGSIDIVMETKDYVYVMELKLDKSAQEALNQIENKEYALPWKYDCRKVFKIGISFSSETRNIAAWEIGK